MQFNSGGLSKHRSLVPMFQIKCSGFSRSDGLRSQWLKSSIHLVFAPEKCFTYTLYSFSSLREISYPFTYLIMYHLILLRIFCSRSTIFSTFDLSDLTDFGLPVSCVLVYQFFYLLFYMMFHSIQLIRPYKLVLLLLQFDLLLIQFFLQIILYCLLIILG